MNIDLVAKNLKAQEDKYKEQLKEKDAEIRELKIFQQLYSELKDSDGILKDEIKQWNQKWDDKCTELGTFYRNQTKGMLDAEEQKDDEIERLKSILQNISDNIDKEWNDVEDDFYRTYGDYNYETIQKEILEGLK